MKAVEFKAPDVVNLENDFDYCNWIQVNEDLFRGSADNDLKFLIKLHQWNEKGEN